MSTNKKSVHVTLVILVITIFSTIGLAQNQRGSIRGSVTNESGKVISNIVVTLESDALIAGRITLNIGERGQYRFVRLPIGVYKIAVSAKDYKKYVHEHIRLEIGQTILLNPVMVLGDFAEVIEITSEAPLIDVTSTDTSTTLTGELLKSLPRPSFSLDTLNFTPTGTGTSISGGSADTGNSYQIDGVDVSDPESGSAWIMSDFDIAEEIQIVPFAGSTADVGGFTGGAINIVTKSGGNSFSGGISYYYQDEDLIDSNINDEELEARNTVNYFNSNFNAQLGGPIAKDRVWFYGNYKAYTTKTRSGVIPATLELPNALAKLTIALNENMTLSGMYHFTDIIQDGRGAAFNMTPDTLLDQKTPNHAYSAQWAWIISQNDILEAKYTGFTGSLDLNPRGSGPHYFDVYQDQGFGNSQTWVNFDRKKNNMKLDYTKFLPDLAGTHEIKFGFEAAFGESENLVHLERINVIDGTIPLSRIAYDRDDYSNEKYKSYNFYIAESWSLNDRLYLNVGLRYENQTIEIPDQDHPDGTMIAGLGDVHTFNNLAPRIGVTYQLTADGNHIVRASYGRYFDALTTGLFHELNPAASSLLVQVWMGDQWFTIASESPENYTLDDDIEAYHKDAITFGYEAQLFKDFAVGIDYIMSRSSNVIANIDRGRTYTPIDISFGGRTFNVFDYTGGKYDYLITNADDDELYSDYDALIFSVKKRFSSNWQTQTSLTLSNHRGTAQDFNNTDGSLINGDLAYYQHPNNQINADGSFYYHRPWSLKSSGSYLLPYDVSVAWFMKYEAGRRWAPLLTYASDTLAEGTVTFLTDERGSQTYDPVFQLDMRLMKAFQIDSLNLALSLDLYNVFNNDTVISVEQSFQSPVFGEPVYLQGSRTAQIGLRLEF